MSGNIKILPVKAGEKVLRLWFLVIIFLLIFFLLPGYSPPVLGEPQTEAHSIEPASPVGADIFIESLTVEPRGFYYWTESRTATIVIKNRGNASSSGFWLDFYKNIDNKPTPGMIGDINYWINSLPAGATFTLTIHFPMPLNMHWKAWAQAQTTQTRNGEHPVYGPYQYDRSYLNLTGDPEIVIDSLTVAPSTSSLGDELTATIVVRNIGYETTYNSSFSVDFYPDRATAPPTWASGIATSIEAGFAPGAYEIIVFKFTPTSVGNKQAWAQADRNDQVSGPVVAGPFNYFVDDVANDYVDLVIESMTVEPSSSELGTELSATVTMKNNGNMASAEFTLHFYFNRETAPVPGEFGDMGLIIPPIDPGDDYICTFTFTPPATGSYQAWAQASFLSPIGGFHSVYGPVYYEVVDSVDDFVNLVMVDMYIDPFMSEPATELTATIDLKNEGNTVSDGFYLDFYYDKNIPPDPGEEGDDWRYIFPLAPGETRTETFTFTQAEAGTYQALARAQTIQTASGDYPILDFVYYVVEDFDGHLIHRINFDPTWPDELEYGDNVSFNFEYTTTNPGEVYIWATAMSGGIEAPNQLSTYSSFPSGTDIGSGSFRIQDVGQTEDLVIDGVKFEMHCAETLDGPEGLDSLLYEVVVDVDYTYVYPDSDIELPATPSLTSPVHGQIVDGSSVMLNWETAEGATHYAVWIYNLSKDEMVILTAPIEETFYTHEGFADDGDIYAWSVVASNIDDQTWGDFAIPIAFINGSDADLLPPTLTSPSHLGTVSEIIVLLQWEASPGADIYTILVADLDTGEYLDGYDGTQLFTGTYHVVEGLSGGGTTYFWSVSAADSSTPGSWSTYAFPWLFTSE